MRILFCFLFVFITGVSVAQLSRKERKAAAEESATANQPNSLSPAHEEHRTATRFSKRKLKAAGLTYNSQKDFEKRMEARAKVYRKNEKMMETPQYKNPLYFGHKHPPKKHRPDKMKYCKECGIRH